MPVFLWVAIIVYFAVNVPWFDDFDPFPDFLRQWINNTNTIDRLRLILKPNNEHRMVFGKLLTIIYYLFTGQLNFVFLQLAGASFTIGTCFILWRSFKGSKITWWYFMPVPFLLFQFQYHMTFLWSICSLQHQPVIFFVCLSMFLLSKERLVLGIAAAICATFAMSSGIFVWVAGGAVLLYMSRFKHLGAWCLVGAIAVGCYFYGMSAQGNESSLGFLMKNPHLSVLGFLAFLGGLFDFFPWLRIEFRTALPIIASFLLLIWIGTWLLSMFIPWLQQYWKGLNGLSRYMKTLGAHGAGAQQLSIFTMGVMVFLLTNALAIGLLRPRFGFFVMVVSNYKIYPALFLSITYLAYLSVTVGKNYQLKRVRQVLAVSLLIWVLSAYSYLPVISERRKDLVVNGYNQENNAFGLGHVPFSKTAVYVDELMKELIAQDVYSYPTESMILTRALKRARPFSTKEMGIAFGVENNEIHVRDPLSHFNYDHLGGNYVFLTNDKKVYLFRMEQDHYTGRNFFRQFAKGCEVRIPFSSLVPGTYQVDLLKFGADRAVSGTLSTVTIPERPLEDLL